MSNIYKSYLSSSTVLYSLSNCTYAVAITSLLHGRLRDSQVSQHSYFIRNTFMKNKKTVTHGNE